MGNGPLNGDVPANDDRKSDNGREGRSAAAQMTASATQQPATAAANGAKGDAMGGETMLKTGGGGGATMNVVANGKASNSEHNTAAPVPSLPQPPTATRSTRMNDLPDEIQHVTSNFVSLGFLLQRLAQKTHNNLQDVIRELAQRPVADMAATANGLGGRAAAAAAAAEDGSIENIEKKKTLLDFARTEHANWVKALVITEWSKKAAQISKLIDLENHMFEEELIKYEQAVFTMLNLKRNLNGARVPSPDLKTALHVLSRGTAPWMPDVGFIAAPPLTPEEQLRWLNNISTLLSLRLNLADHDTIPPAFRGHYTIASGRVTFRVAGEFAVDLTLASDDFSQQLWFLDLRFLFTPAPRALTDSLRQALEDQVNSILAHDGLSGCYRCLHEYVLTHQINELRRQFRDLAFRSRWVETLKVEQLNRAFCVQYWGTRYATAGLKSWILIGVHSGRKGDGNKDGAGAFPDAARPEGEEEQTTSRLSLRWFRDNKEVKGPEVEGILQEAGLGRESGSDDDNDDNDNEKETTTVVSAEKILQVVVARHIAHILGGIHAKLQAKPLFAKRLATMRLVTAPPGATTSSSLTVQLTRSDRVCVRLDPVTGLFSLSPKSHIALLSELRINGGSGSAATRASAAAGGADVDPVEEGFAMLESVRCQSVQDELGRRAKTSGWAVVRGAAGLLKTDELRQMINQREAYQVLCLKRQDWAPEWHVLASLSLSGDRWWLLKLSDAGRRIATHMQLPMGASPNDFDDTFFPNLTAFAVGVMSQYLDTQALLHRRKASGAASSFNPFLPSRAKLPIMHLRLSDLLASASSPSSSAAAATAVAAEVSSAGSGGGSHRGSSRSQQQHNAWWASDVVQLLYRGVDMDNVDGGNDNDNDKATRSGPAKPKVRARWLGVLAEARLTVVDRAKFQLLSGGGAAGGVDRDVAFDARTGQFCLYLRTEAGRSVVDKLVQRLRAIEQLVGFLDAIRRQGSAVQCGTVTLRRLEFSYGVGVLLGGGSGAVLEDDGGSGSGSSSGGRRWKVSVDLSSRDSDSSSGGGVMLRLEQGCPHLRVADFLNSIARDPSGFAAVPFLLTTTLSLHRVLDRMEDAWEPVHMRNSGLLGIFPRALDWVVVRFLLPGGVGGAGRLRQLMLEIRLRKRRGETLWQIRRMDGGDADDDLGKVLKQVFEGSASGDGRGGGGGGNNCTSRGWTGLLTAAVASPYVILPATTPSTAMTDGMVTTTAGPVVFPTPSSGPAPPSQAASSGSGSGGRLAGIEDCLLQIDEGVRALLTASQQQQQHLLQLQQQQQQQLHNLHNPSLPPPPANLSMAQLQQRRAQVQLLQQQQQLQHQQQQQLQQQQHQQLQQLQQHQAGGGGQVPQAQQAQMM